MIAQVFERNRQRRTLVSLLMLPLSWLYRLMIALRRMGYRLGIFSSTKVALPVVVVGNISVGGSGKTPMVIWLVRWLQQQGLKPGVILRGYGGNANEWPVLISENTSAEQIGDEALLIHRSLGAPVVAGPVRVDDCRKLSHMDVNVIVSDDGLQHLAMRRDFELVMVNQASMNKQCLITNLLR